MTNLLLLTYLNNKSYNLILNEMKNPMKIFYYKFVKIIVDIAKQANFLIMYLWYTII